MNQDIRKLLLAAKWVVMQAERDEIELEDCKQAVALLGWGSSNDPFQSLPDDWNDIALTHEQVKLSADVKALLEQHKKRDGFVRALGREPNRIRLDIGLGAGSGAESEDRGDGQDASKYAQGWLQQVAAIKEQLSQTVLGQEAAIEVVCDGLSKQVYRSNTQSPVGVFLFVGPSATGKTMLAHALADALGDEWECTSVQMGTMSSEKDGFQIYGLTEGYSDAKPGKVTEFVRKHPKSIVVFEDFDRAHANVRAGILDVFNRGVMVDQYYDTTDSPDEDPEVSFQQAIVICTSKSDADMYETAEFQNLISKHPQQLESIVLNALARSTVATKTAPAKSGISSAFLSGLASGSTALFRNLDLPALSLCAERSIEKGVEQLKSALDLQIHCNARSEIAQALVLSFAPEVNALTAANDLLERLFDPITDYIQQHRDTKLSELRICFAQGQEQVLANILAGFGGKEPVREMFRKNQTLHLALALRESDDGLLLELGALAIERVSHAHDFGGAGAIRTEVPEVSFEQIAGHHKVKQRLLEIVKLLKDPCLIANLGVDVPKGLLLWGQPGTGKTMLAKALAHEADLPFISTTGSELLDLELMKSIFTRARKYAPSILFIDEIDAIGARDGGRIDIIINQLLTEVDGFDTSLAAPVFIIAATNLPDKIDAALTRSGRIDLKVEVPMLDRDARIHFIDAYFKLPNDGSLNRDALLSYTAGMSGADLEMVKREAVLEMVSSGKDRVSMALLTEQINTLKYGVRSVNQKLLQSLESTAYHEAGHAIVSMVVNPDVLIEQVTVMPREGALGFVSYDIESAQYRQINRQEVLDTMAVALAGRMAQTRQFPDWGDDSGASSDLEHATFWATYAVSKLGLDAEFGNVVLSPKNKLPELTEGGLLFERVQAWLNEAEGQCADVLEKQWAQVDALAKRLIKEEVVTGEKLRADFMPLLEKEV